jgi:hypothetical protein
MAQYPDGVAPDRELSFPRRDHSKCCDTPPDVLVSVAFSYYFAFT